MGWLFIVFNNPNVNTPADSFRALPLEDYIINVPISWHNMGSYVRINQEAANVAHGDGLQRQTPKVTAVSGTSGG